MLGNYPKPGNVYRYKYEWIKSATSEGTNWLDTFMPCNLDASLSPGYGGCKLIQEGLGRVNICRYAGLGLETLKKNGGSICDPCTVRDQFVVGGLTLKQAVTPK